MPGVYSGGVGCSSVSVPVVCNFVIVEDVEPGQGRGDRGPVWGGVDLAVFTAVCLDVGAETAGDIDVDKVT